MSENQTTEQKEVKAAAKPERGAAKPERAPKEAGNKFKINVPALPFTEAIFGLPKSIQPKPFKEGGGGQIQIVQGLLRMGATQAWLPFGVALRWTGTNTAKLVPAIQLPKMASNRFEAAIRTDDVQTKIALDTLERDLAAAAVKFYNAERQKSERSTGAAITNAVAVQTFNAADLGFVLDDVAPAKGKGKGKNQPPAADGDGDGDE